MQGKGDQPEQHELILDFLQEIEISDVSVMLETMLHGVKALVDRRESQEAMPGRNYVSNQNLNIVLQIYIISYLLDRKG